MTIISERLNQGTTLSFEFFTPKDAAGQDRLDQNIEHLMNFSPDFLSITYGAAGTSRARTIGWVERLSTRYSVPIMPHLTCISHTKSEINSYNSCLGDDSFKSELMLITYSLLDLVNNFSFLSNNAFL